MKNRDFSVLVFISWIYGSVLNPTKGVSGGTVANDFRNADT